MPRFAIAPLGLTTEGSTKFKLKGWKWYLKKLQCKTGIVFPKTETLVVLWKIYYWIILFNSFDYCYIAIRFYIWKIVSLTKSPVLNNVQKCPTCVFKNLIHPGVHLIYMQALVLASESPCQASSVKRTKGKPLRAGFRTFRLCLGIYLCTKFVHGRLSTVWSKRRVPWAH